MSKKSDRIAIIIKEKCKPNKCNFECGLICPINRQKKECVKIVDMEDIGKTGTVKKIAKINEDFCIGCGMCTKEQVGCPFGAVMIVNVPTELKQDIVHRFGPNGFRLYRMPILKPGIVLGLLGQNGIGKSTIVNILSNNFKPNFERFNETIPIVTNKTDKTNKSIMTDQEIISMFKGSEMHKYMSKLYSDNFTTNVKPQHVDLVVNFLKSKNLNPTARDFLNRRSNFDPSEEWYTEVINTLEMNLFLDSKVITLSGGELQRLICAVTLLSKANVFIFDEPTNYLDVKQRLNVSKLIRSLVRPDVYVIVIEHDLSILDYISDNICIMFGKPSAYGVVSRPIGTAEAINSYFDGYIASENMRFRPNEYDIVSINASEGADKIFSENKTTYEGGIVTYDNFELNILGGDVPIEGSITVVMGRNGTGKTTFINYIANKLKDNCVISHKPQYLSINNFAHTDGTYPTVNEFLFNNIRNSYLNEMFKTDVVGPLEIGLIADRKLNELSGGELQRFWVVYSLGVEAQVYLLDECSANLDIEVRTTITKVIKRFAIHNKRMVFLVEHDMMMNVAMGSEQNTQTIIVDTIDMTNTTNTIDSTEHTNIKRCQASAPMDFTTGINRFLEILGITFHTQSRSRHQRPRINKLNSVKDREQKLSGKYYD